MKRPTNEPPSCSDDKRSRVERSVLATSSCSKAGLARILLKLHSEGCLIEGVVSSASATESSIRQSIIKSVKARADEHTPFGPLIQEMELPTTPPTKWPFIHPMALVFFLSQYSQPFSNLMSSSITAATDNILRVVVYIDEAIPGNVLRPDGGRGSQNIYWGFAEWPEWYLRRDDSWFVFGCVRTSLLESLRGGISELMKLVLRVFFHPTGSNFATTGGLIQRTPSESVVFKAKLAGLLGDEKGMKEVFCTKGHGGMRCCLSCKNICQFCDAVIDGDTYMQGIDCVDPSKFDKACDDDVYEIVDMLQASIGRSKKEIERLEISTGLHCNPNALLFDADARLYVKPVSGWFRDWMHVMAVSGCANIEIQQLVVALTSIGILPEMISEWFSRWHLPKAHGKIDHRWFTVKRLGKPSDAKDGFKGFSGEVLTIVPILAAFLKVVVRPMGVLPQNISCFLLLERLLKLFSLGAESVMPHVNLVEHTIREHAVLFKELYAPLIKPKFHHLYHIVDHMHNLGKLLSCFVTERKHRMVKQTAGHSFRHFEVNLARDLLNGMLERFSAKEDIFSPESLVSPQPLQADASHRYAFLPEDLAHEISFSTRAVLKCGLICSGDIVMLSDQVVGRLEVFVAVQMNSGQAIFCLVHRMHRSADGLYLPASEPIPAASADVLGALVWCEDEGRFRVIPPPASATW